jgi:hypothetical protein
MFTKLQVSHFDESGEFTGLSNSNFTINSPRIRTKIVQVSRGSVFGFLGFLVGWLFLLPPDIAFFQSKKYLFVRALNYSSFPRSFVPPSAVPFAFPARVVCFLFFKLIVNEFTKVLASSFPFPVLRLVLLVVHSVRFLPVFPCLHPRSFLFLPYFLLGSFLFAPSLRRLFAFQLPHCIYT